MIKNYLKVAFRSLKRNKGYTIINVLGLAIGIAFSCIIYIYVDHELSADNFHEKSDRTFRVLSVDKRVPDNIVTFGVTSPPLPEALREDFPEVLDITRLYRFTGQVVYEMDGQSFQERAWYIAEKNFLDVFDYEVIAGDPSTALAEPFSLVLNESTAKKFYGDENAVGKTIKFATYRDLSFTVTAVLKDLPANSHIQFNMLLSESRNDEGWLNSLKDWQNFSAFSYVVLQESSSIETLEEGIPEFEKKYLGPYAEVFDTKFQNIQEIYFGSDGIRNGIESERGQISYIYIFATMGLFILLVACINYINLATSKAVFRSKEIGIRKVVGAHKKQLIFQFLTESLMVTLMATIISIGIIDLTLPFFNSIVEKEFDLSLTTLGEYALPLLLIATIIALFSGSYPAFYLSQLKPVDSLKGQGASSKGSGSLRKGLVTFQFVLTIVMLVSSLLIGQQLSFIQEKDMGFNKEQLLVIDINSGNVRRQFQSVKNEFEAIPGVERVGVSTRVPGEWKNINEVFLKPNSSNWEANDSLKTYFMGFDEGMIDTYRFELVAGKYFIDNSGDSTHILLNEAAVKAMNLENPVGKTIRVLSHQSHWQSSYTGTVIGVLKDFNFQSLHHKVAPIVISTWNNPVRPIDYFTLKVSGNPSQVIELASAVHEKFDQYTTMESHFLDKQLDNFYIAETRASMIFKLSAGLCIFVACLGLLGLASFMVEKRKKELGIRKILGANDLSLFVLLSSNISKQVIIAFVIACPIAWWMMTNWLESFQFRITPGVGTFLFAGAVALLIALLTISYRAFKAIYSNPVDSLRQE